MSIVICAYNDEDTIGPVVQGAADLSYPHKEIIVINDHSSDATASVVATFPQVRLVNNPRNLGLGGSMNVGLAQARGDIVVYVQSDCAISDPDWLDKMLAPFADPKVGAVVSQRKVSHWQRLPFGAKLFDTVAPQALRNPWGEPREIDFFRGKADAYRRHVLVELGGFDSATFFTSGEDTDLSIKMRRAGYRIVLSPDADLDYLFSGRQNSVGGGLRKALLYGRSAALLFRRHGYDGLRTRHFLLALVSFLLGPWWLVHPQSSFWGYLPPLVASFRVGVRARPFRIRLPLALVSLLILAALALWRGLFWPGDLGASLLLTCGLFTLAVAGRSPVYAWRQGAGPGLTLGAFGYAVAWRLLSGVGYLQGRLGMVARAFQRQDTAAHGAALGPKFVALLEMMGEVRGQTILDLGAGGGGLLSALASTNRCLGLDLDWESCCTMASRGIPAIRGDATQLPLREGFFDIVIASEVVEHVPEVETFFAEARRVLRNQAEGSGQVFLVVPNDRNWFWFRLANLNLAAAFRDRGHMRRFPSLAEVKELCQRHAFRVLAARELRQPIRWGYGRRGSMPWGRLTLHYLIQAAVES